MINFRDNNNKNRRNDINYEITSMKLNVTIRRKKKNFKKKITKNKNCVTSVINRVISHENIRRAMIYDVENSILCSNMYSQIMKNKKLSKTRYSQISIRKKITTKKYVKN